MHIFDRDGSPLSYEHLGRLAPEPPAPHTVKGRAYLEVPFEFETLARDMTELKEDFIAQHDVTDADSIILEVEDE